MKRYHVRDRLTNEYMKNDEGKNVEVSEITKRTYDMLQEEFDLLGNVVIEEIPQVINENLVSSYQGGVNDND